MGLTLTRATKVVALCTNLGLKEEHERAVQRLAEVRAAEAQDAREVSTGARDAAEAVQALEREMREHTVSFTVQALPRKAWAEFVAAHPPREGNEVDKSIDLDQSALDEAIAPSIIRVTDRAGELVDFTPETDWVPLADEMSTAQWNEFAMAVLALNNGVTAAPFSPAASLVIQRSEQTSKRPSASE